MRSFCEKNLTRKEKISETQSCSTSDVRTTDLNRLLNKLSNQRIRYNTRKLIQIAAIYHRSNRKLSQLGRIIARSSSSSSSSSCSSSSTQFDINTVKGEILTRAEKSRVTIKRQRRRIKNGATILDFVLTQMADRPYVRLLNALFNHETSCPSRPTSSSSSSSSSSNGDNGGENGDSVPLLAMRTPEEVDLVIGECKRAIVFPYHLLPPNLRSPMRSLLETRK